MAFGDLFIQALLTPPPSNGRDINIPYYNIISGSNVIFQYPTTDTFNVTGDFSSSLYNKFLVSANTIATSSFVTTLDMIGELKINTIKLSYPHKLAFYPPDVSGAIFDEYKGLSLHSIISNESIVNLICAFQHEFKYHSLTGGISGYASRGISNIMFNSLEDIRIPVINGLPATAVQNFTIIDNLMQPVSGTYISGLAEVDFKISQADGALVGIENINYNWESSLEDSSFNISNDMNINASIGHPYNERWGTPLWSRAFTEPINFSQNYIFNTRNNKSNGNHIIEIYITDSLTFSANSVMSLKNNRIHVSANEQMQIHDALMMNNIEIVSLWGVKSVEFESTPIGELYITDSNITYGTGCIETYTPSSAIINITGGITSDALSCNPLFPNSNCCSAGGYSFPSHFFLKSTTDNTDESTEIRTIKLEYDYIDECIWKVNTITYVPVLSNQEFKFETDSSCLYSCPNTLVESLVTGSITSSNKIYEFPTDNNFVLNDIGSSILSGNTYFKTVTYNFMDATYWKYYSSELISYLPLDCTLSTLTPLVSISGTEFIESSPTTIVSTGISGSFTSSSAQCCSGVKIFPNDFTFISETQTVSGSALYSIIRYDLFNTCANTLQSSIYLTLIPKNNGTLSVSLEACPAGNFYVELQNCESTSCEHLDSYELTENTISLGNTGHVYSEYATNFIQEYRDDNRYSVPEYLVTSNVNNILTPNKGETSHSSWRRYMDGVGLGGDAPDYDSISISGAGFKKIKVHPVTEWREVGFWNIGQMAFGTPEKSVIVGGHKISRNTGDTLFGSGLHSAPTSKRVYIWNTSSIPEEDSYLKNYYGRRFNTFFPTTTVAISSNECKTSLNCIIFDAESNIDVERFGTAAFNKNTNSIDVTFDIPMPAEVSEKYYLSLTCNQNVKVWWENKTAEGFTLKSELDNWNGTVDYMATTTIPTTEKDILENPTQSGYIFKK